jgi:hypothetical protein
MVETQLYETFDTLMELNNHQPFPHSPVQLYERRVCSICSKRRSCSSRKMSPLDHHICSRRPCAKLKALLADTYISRTLTVDIHHYYHPAIANDNMQPCVGVFEMHGNTSLVNQAELPGDFSHFQEEKRLATISEELPDIVKTKKPWRTL